LITLRANRVCLFVWSLQVFYQVCSGATAAERQAYCLENANYYYYLSVSGCYQVPGINDVEDWREMTESMQTVGINESERQEVIRSIAVCLWLGNIAFVEKRDEVAEVQDRAVLDIAAGLLQVQPAALEAALCNRQIQTGVGARAEKYIKPNTAAASDFSRDTLAKAIFTRLFDYLVAKINISIQKDNFQGIQIGVLDIYGEAPGGARNTVRGPAARPGCARLMSLTSYSHSCCSCTGFEIFEFNSFEQL